MRKIFKCLTAILMATLICGLSFNLTALAEYDDGTPIWLTADSLTIEQGKSKDVAVYATNYISYYLVGQESSGTYATFDGSNSGGTLTVYVASDEGANTFHIYVYLDGAGEVYKDLEINVMKVYSAIAAVNNNATTTISVPYADGTTGTLTLTTEKKIGMFYTASGVAMASFSISNSYGKLMQLTLGAVVSNGSNYITVKTPTTGTINISASDKAVLQAQGIAGLYLNGAYVNWP